MDKVFTFQGPDPKDPKLMLIGMEGRVTLEPAEDVAAKIRSPGGQGEPDLRRRGRPHRQRAALTQKTEMAMSVMGQEIDQITETTSTMTLVP